MTVQPDSAYEFLSGTGIEGLPQLGRCLSGDQFLISRKQLRTQNPKWWFSRRLAYSDLSARIAADLSSKFGFGSMAYEDEDDYALVDHKHSDYNWVDIVSPYENTKEFDGSYNYGDNPPAVTVAKVWIDGDVRVVKMPLPVIEQEDLDRPAPGQLKMMAVTSLAAIDVNAADFDGWVYADGATYPNSFEYSSYFPQVAGNKFQVPEIKNILELNNKPYEDAGSGKIGHANA